MHPVKRNRQPRKGDLGDLATAMSWSESTMQDDQHTGYSRSKASKASDSKTSQSTLEDNKDVLHLQKGDVLNERYQILDFLGEGGFGTVLKVMELNTKEVMALKMSKSVPKDRKAALSEVKILEKISKKDPNCIHLCVQMLNWFDFNSCICICFELLGPSILDFINSRYYRPYDLGTTCSISYQVFYAVQFLHKIGITHHDLKPENILFLSPSLEELDNKKKQKRRQMEIRIIDFGSSCFDGDDHRNVAFTRQYRSLEIILDLGSSYPSDVWAIACVIFEIYVGETLFQAHDNREHLAMMERVLGPVPKRIALASKSKYFHHGTLIWNVRSYAGRYVRQKCSPLYKYKNSKDEDEDNLFHLLSQMLEYDPHSRLTLIEGSHHEFFDNIPGRQRFRGF